MHKSSGTRAPWGAGLYLVAVLAWPALKLAGYTSATWWRVTSLLWGPWVLLAALGVAGVAILLAQGGRRI